MIDQPDTSNESEKDNLGRKDTTVDKEPGDIDPALIRLMSTVSSQAEIPLDLRGTQERSIRELKALQAKTQSEASKAALGKLIKLLEEAPILVNLSAKEMNRPRGCF